MLLFFIYLLMVVVLLFTVVHADDQDGDYDGQCKQVCRLNIPEEDNQSTIFIVAQQQQWERQIWNHKSVQILQFFSSHFCENT